MSNKVADVTIYHECPDGTSGKTVWYAPENRWGKPIEPVNFCDNCGEILEPVFYGDVVEAATSAANK